MYFDERKTEQPVVVLEKRSSGRHSLTKGLVLATV
jgi:hypothetical protein